MKNYKVLNSNGEIVAYIVNSKNEHGAKEMAMEHEDYSSIEECESLNIPGMFQNCLMDEKTVNQFK